MVKDSEASKAGSGANPTYAKWLLEAVRKVRFQRQRPCLERVKRAVRQCHKLSEKTIVEQLELAVKHGILLKVCSKGLYSYKDPKWVSNLSSRTLHLDREADLIRIIIRSVRELGSADGSTLKAVEQHISNSYTIESGDHTDLMQQIRVCTKKAVAAERLIQNGHKYKVGQSELTETDALTAYYEELTANVERREQTKVRTK